MDTVHTSLGGVDSATVEDSQPHVSGFASTSFPEGVPGDFHDFMRDVLGDEPELSPEELDPMYPSWPDSPAHL
ncbi:MAG TPA: hypothetical protein VFE58_02540 [Tepidisphaeraceae bacterium]|jgi:hypothetical protein|nr:hypothetical protein [Tepidisphaeraceae bacterium]